MSEPIILAIIGACSAGFAAFMSFQMAKLNKSQAATITKQEELAHKQLVTNAKVDDVASTLAVNKVERDAKLESLSQSQQKMHDMINSLTADQLRRLQERLPVDTEYKLK